MILSTYRSSDSICFTVRQAGCVDHTIDHSFTFAERMLCALDSDDSVILTCDRWVVARAINNVCVGQVTAIIRRLLVQTRPPLMRGKRAVLSTPGRLSVDNVLRILAGLCRVSEAICRIQFLSVHSLRPSRCHFYR